MGFGAIKALTFDCYGTLIDWEQGILDRMRPWAERNGLQVADERLLELYGEIEAACEAATPTAPYTEILRTVHGRIATCLGVAPDAGEADRFAASVGDWMPFPDMADALRALKLRFKLVIVSNVDRASFARTNAKLGVTFDAIVTAEEVGAYKPDHRMFQRAFEVLETTGIRRHEILHVAQSLYHDHVPAKALGMRTAWVDRRKGLAGGGATRPPDVTVLPDYTVSSLAELVRLLET
ncbi:MAG: haloacid dehalogenase type II [candidate division Zixibacteria bacterium]|nr:haloacid dehalogenase type II [candidate division Zixibacteria bacterium]